MIKGSKRTKNLISECVHCNQKFPCSDPKASRCENCKKCLDCGIIIKRGLHRYCIKCQRKNHRTEKQNKQLADVHLSTKANNPSKKPEVRAKLSATKMGDLNPARIYIEQYREHIAKYRPKKISKLEDSLAQYLPEFSRQFEVAWYKIDFADPKNKIALEVQGCWHHSCKQCFPESPTHATQRKVKGNDARKLKFLKNNGWKVIYIYEHEIRNISSDAIILRLKTLLDSHFQNANSVIQFI